MATAKENSNPQIYNVEKERAHTRRTPLDWSQLGTFQTNSSGGVKDIEALSFHHNSSEVPVPTTAQDKAILKALVDCSMATNGKGVNLLQQAGLNIPEYVKKSSYSDPPLFRIVHTSHDAKDKAKSTIALAEEQEQQEPTSSTKTRPAPQDDELTAEEVFDIVRNIQDPEHPHTLEELGVVSLEQVELVSESNSTIAVNVRFTPTIPHCSMATLIGLCLRVKLHRSLPLGRFKVSVQIEPGTHASEKAINKQLRDKERVCAALENKHLAGVVNKCIRQGMAT